VPWEPPSVRVRLTAWYATTLTVVLMIYAVGVFTFVRQSLESTLDQQLDDEVEAAEELLMRSASGEIVRRASPHDADEEDRWTEVWSQAGALLYRSESAARASLPPLTGNRPAAQSGSRTSANGTPLRVLARNAWIDGSPVVMRVARSEASLRRELRELLGVMAIGLPFAIGLAAVGGYVLARRALSPIDRLRERAKSITAERLTDRLPVDNPHDELGRLAMTFNEMLGGLDTAFEQMRRFTADASHELRTPLTALRSVGEVALREHRDEQTYRDVIGSMLEEVDRLTRLVDGLLTLSRADAGHTRLVVERVDLVGLSREVSTHLQVLAEEKQQTIELRAPRAVFVNADRLALRQALINLLDNAIKYGPARSTIRLRVEDGAADATIDVTDAGPGIAPEHRERIFDRFYRIDAARSRDRGGVGLGLAIARWAVQMNGGRLELEPMAPDGTTFRIRLRSEGADSGTGTSH
jgi:heavy metal sensor kinase